jgi:transglutaminase-like putative cysteine protease
MIKKAVELIGGAKQTGVLMHKLAKTYHFDMCPYNSMSILEIFDLIKSIPFRPDPPGHELVQRPIYTLKNGGDCDDKSIAGAAYFINNGIPYRFKAVSYETGRNPALSHVYLEYFLLNKWLVFDATYSYNVIGQQEPYTRSEFI